MKYLVRYMMFLAAAGVLFLSTVRADEWDKRTVVTIDQPIEIPNQVLQPGTYVFKLVNSPSDRHIVQVFDKNEKHLMATILAIPNYRLEPTGKTQMTFWEREAGTPSALRAWFYPGDNFGQEFAYPPEQASKIAAYAHQPVETTTAKSSEYAKAEVTQTQPPTSTAQAPPPPPTPAQTEPAPPPQPRQEAAPPPPPPSETQPQQPTTPPPAPAPAPQPSQPPSELPHTASSTPLVGLIGLLALIGGAVTFLIPARSRY